MKNIKRLCGNCGSPFYTAGKNEHHYCSLLCLADNVTVKRKNDFEATDCWIWHDEEAELVNREAKEVFSLREALLGDHGIKTKGKFIGMRCERRCCVNPYHVMVCDR